MTTYLNIVGKKITFQSYNEVQTFDPNKKYYYFICLDHFNFDFSVYFQMLGRSKLKRLHENNIPLFFAHDLETIPHIEYYFFVKQLEWLFLMRGVYSDVQNEIIISTASNLIPRQANFIKQYFYNQFKFISSPLILKYSVDELSSIYPPENQIDVLHKTPKIRQFTCLNRTPRFHRTTLLHGLRAHNLMDQGAISNGNQGYYTTEAITSNTEYAISIKEDMSKGMIPLMELDSYRFIDNRPNSIPAFPEALWKTYYDLVSETGVIYYSLDPLDLSLVTEKLTKSLLLKRPFMVNGGPYTLKLLKNFGFKTYDLMFDESYDDAENLIDRQEIIVNNIRRYINKYDVLDKLTYEAKTIAQFNRDRVLTVDYEQLLMNELVKL
jgi:hypothetical protein